MVRAAGPDNPRLAALHEELDDLRVRLSLLHDADNPDPGEVGRIRLAIFELENRIKRPWTLE